MTRRPLYGETADSATAGDARGVDDALALHCRQGGNRGLWYHKLFDLWGGSGRDWQMPGGQEKTEWIARTGWTVDHGPLRQGWKRPELIDKCGGAKMLEEASARIEHLVRAQGGAVLEAYDGRALRHRHRIAAPGRERVSVAPHARRAVSAGQRRQGHRAELGPRLGQ